LHDKATVPVRNESWRPNLTRRNGRYRGKPEAREHATELPLSARFRTFRRILLPAYFLLSGHSRPRPGALPRTAWRRVPAGVWSGGLTVPRGSQMSAPPDSTLADPKEVIADLQRELAQRTAERDEALAQ